MGKVYLSYPLVYIHDPSAIEMLQTCNLGLLLTCNLLLVLPQRYCSCALWLRERNDGLYKVITYLCAKMIDEIVLSTIAALVFSCVVYFPLKLVGSWLVFFLVFLTSLSCGIGTRPAKCFFGIANALHDKIAGFVCDDLAFHFGVLVEVLMELRRTCFSAYAAGFEYVYVGHNLLQISVARYL